MLSIKKIKPEYIACSITALIIFIFFMHTLDYSWKYFDEQMIYNETLLPVPTSIFETLTYILNFGLYNFFEASNTFYSSITNLRCNPINTLISLFAYTIFQKNSFYYHLASLVLHIFNACILFFILNKVYKGSNQVEEKSNYKLLLISSLTLIWALHPTIIESIAFITNWVGVLSYSFFLLTLFLFLTEASSIVLFFTFLLSIFICEYSVTLPLILFFYSFAMHKSNSLPEKIKYAFKRTFPLFLGLLIYIFSFFSLPTRTNFISYPFPVILERVFWLSPQVFFHFIKLIFFPLHLTIDQAGNILFGKTIFDPYAIFCFSLMYSTIAFLLFSIFNTNKRNNKNIIILISSFLLSLLPFLQIISPTYCLASERYLYLPLFFLIFGISHFLFDLKARKLLLGIVIFLLVIYSGRSYIRTFDWKDSITLFSSAYKENSNPLLKAIRLQFVGTLLVSPDNPIEIRSHGIDHINGSISILKNYFDDLEGKKNIQTPKVLKAYGLDSKTLQAKTAYLLAFERFGLEMDLKGAYEILKPFMDDKSIRDPSVISFYANLLSSLNKTDEAKKLLEESCGKTMSPLTLVPLVNIYIDEKNFTAGEKGLKLLYKYFPYNIQVLETMKKFYFITGNKKNFEHFSELHKLRMHIISK